MRYAIVLWLAIALGSPASAFATDAPVAGNPAPVSWSVWGGEVGVHWNRDLANDIGLRIEAPVARLPDARDHHFERFDVRRSGALELRIDNGHFRGFGGGSLQARGGYLIDLADGRIDLRDFRLVPRADNPFLLDLVGADGKAWFYIDRLMYEKVGQDDLLSVRTMDVRVSADLAARLGQPEVAGWTIADMELNSDMLVHGTQPLVTGATCDVYTGAGCHFSGTAAPSGGTYQADLFMKTFTPQYTRCADCGGPGGSGTVVFTPSSTLKNNVNAGTIATTIAGQGTLGTSSALWAADIPWFTMFSGTYPPYSNDQHPFLVWNMYRINADGSIEQIGRSGVKHAFLTTNVGATCPYSSGHVIGVSCEDTYATSNNDDDTRLGPRTEIIPSTNQWGRCGSIYDVNCNGSNDYPDVGPYDYRLKVNEAQLGGAQAAGASFLFESWYLAREDVNIYNSMGTVATTQNWTGSVWSIGSSAYKLGPAIDRWVSPTAPTPNTQNTELASPEGHAKLAVKVTDNGNGTWRYDYAVQNLDFARAVTQGSEPNLRVLSNRGFNRFSVPLPPGAHVSATAFRDGDLVAANDWSADASGGNLTWSAPVDGPTLDWATLYSFSLTSDSAPTSANATLDVAQSGTPANFALATYAPSAVAVPIANAAPTSLGVSVDAGATAASAFALANNGAAGSTLHYTIDFAPSSCATPAAVAWLSATPLTGAIAQAASANINVGVDASSLASGSYSAFVCVHSNDPAAPLIAIGVTATVSASPPTASVTPVHLQATVEEGASTSAAFALANVGSASSTLHYTIDVAPASCTTPAAVAWLSVAPAAGSLASGAPATSVSATIDASALPVGNHSAVVCVHSDDPAQALIEIPLDVVVDVAADDRIFADDFEMATP